MADTLEQRLRAARQFFYIFGTHRKRMQEELASVLARLHDLERMQLVAIRAHDKATGKSQGYLDFGDRALAVFDGREPPYASEEELQAAIAKAKSSS